MSDTEAPAPLFISRQLGGPGYGRRSRARSRSMTLTVKVSEHLVARLDAAMQFTSTYMPAVGTTRSALVARALEKYLTDLERAELRIRLGAIQQTDNEGANDE
jgi:predicted transcriptional regulator